MTVGIFGTRDLPVRDAVLLSPGQPVVLDTEGVAWNGVRLERLGALHVHGFRYEDPVLPEADPACDWSLWQVGAVIRQQTWSFLYSVFAHLEHIAKAGQGPRLYNPISAEVAAFDRLGQLDRLDRAGFAVPPFLASNDDADIAAFQHRHDGVVWRPVTGQATWQWFRDKQRRHLAGVTLPPVLLAAVVPGPLLRAYVLDGRVVLTLSAAAPSRDGLERLETMTALPDPAPEVQATIGRAATTLGLRWAALLLIEGPDGPIFYDVDPDPELSDLPLPFADHLRHCLAAALTGTALPAPPPFPTPLERPSLLLRRMLGIQFDMEQTKYAE